MKKSLIVVLLISFTAVISAALGCKNQAGPAVTPPAHVHDYGEWQTAEKATFEKDGLEERFCKGCNQRTAERSTTKNLRKRLPHIKIPTTIFIFR